MCRFPNTGGLHRTSGDAPLETPTLRDPELITRGGMREGSVVENAVERNIGGSPDVSRCVASQTPEDFTAHLEVHPLKHLLYGILN